MQFPEAPVAEVNFLLDKEVWSQIQVAYETGVNPEEFL